MTSSHTPSAPPPLAAALQAMHGVTHSDSQQTPSTQKPLGHSPPPRHGVALAGPVTRSDAATKKTESTRRSDVDTGAC